MFLRELTRRMADDISKTTSAALNNISSHFNKFAGTTISRKIVDLPKYDNRSPIFEAIKLDKIDKFKQLLYEGVDINSRDELTGNTLVHECVYYDNITILKLLIKLGADLDRLNFRSKTPLLMAIHMGHDKIAIRLLKEEVNLKITYQGNDAFQTALIHNNIKIARILLPLEDLNRLDNIGNNLLMLSLNHKISSITEMLFPFFDYKVTNKKGWNVLHYAVKSNNAHIIHKLKNVDIDLDAVTNKGNTALHLASINGVQDSYIVYTLLDAGASSKIYNSFNQTPLMTAVSYNRFSLVEAFIKRRPNDFHDTNSDGDTAITIGFKKDEAILTYVITHINIKSFRDKKGRNYLMKLINTNF